MRATLSLAFASVLVCSIGADAALAGCKRFGFTVNDYGKEGPIRDAKALLDKHVASWAKEKGIADYRIGPKKVSCDLFLDFIVFDEHTCTASANVCWGDQIGQITSTGDDDGPPPAPLSKAEVHDETPAAQQTAEETTASDDQSETAEADSDDPPVNLINGVEDVAAKAVDPTIELPDMEARAKKKAPVRDVTPPQTADSGPAQDDDAPSTVVETGALSRLPSEPTGKTAPQAPVEEAVPAEDRAAAAAAAAAAATAAERAAAAAETAANAAKEAAAAAVAASNASRGAPAKVVPPLDSASR